VLIVDAKATPVERDALVHFAQAQTAGLLSEILAMETAPIRFEAEVNGRHGYATLEAGNLARISTRMITSGDSICHNEEIFYPPLAEGLMHSMPVVATESAYRGNHLGLIWNEAERRGAFVGHFMK
jgi:hypothetical protein